MPMSSRVCVHSDTQRMPYRLRWLLRCLLMFFHAHIKVLIHNNNNNDRVRYGGCEMHCTSAAVGALVAQEVVKLVTHTFVPLDNCAVYNGIAGTVTQFHLPLD